MNKKINQKATLLNILEGEEISLVKLSANIEINRRILGKLKNHNIQLNDDKFEKLLQAYPEYGAGVVIIENAESSIIEESSSEQKTIKKAKSILGKELETRHRNLNSPISGYHMKVTHRHLLLGRPICPISNTPMMLKEELKIYKSFGEKQKKAFMIGLANPELSKVHMEHRLNSVYA